MAKNSIGQRIKSYRLGRGWTQDKMAGWLEISKATLVRLEHGGKCMELTLAKIERRLSQVEVAA